MNLDLLFVDFETFWSAKVSLSKMSNHEYIRHPEFSVHGAAVARSDEPARWLHGTALRERLLGVDWGGTALVAHNAQFDGRVALESMGAPPARMYIDTQALAVWTAPGRSASLANVARREWPFDESMRKGGDLAETKGRTTEELLWDSAAWGRLARYCLQDLRLTRELLKRLIARVPRREVVFMDMIIKMDLVPCLRLDRAVAAGEHDAAIAADEAMFAAAGVSKDVLRSNQQFAEHLAALGVRVPLKANAKGEAIPAFGKKDPGWLSLRSGNPELESLWDAREASKSRIVETRAASLMKLADASTDALPIPLRYGGAHTLRLGGDGGVNPQNWPKMSRLRDAILPLEIDKILYMWDFSAIECIVTAWIAGEENLLDVFRRGGDPYCEFASRFFRRTITKADPEKRQIGKVSVLGLGFGMGTTAFAAHLASNGVTGMSRVRRRVAQAAVSRHLPEGAGALETGGARAPVHGQRAREPQHRPCGRERRHPYGHGGRSPRAGHAGARARAWSIRRCRSTPSSRR